MVGLGEKPNVVWQVWRGTLGSGAVRVVRNGRVVRVGGDTRPQPFFYIMVVAGPNDPLQSS
jgi:hypothetical protein